MILVDTSVWIDHFTAPDPALQLLLEAGEIRTHPFVIGELSMGSQPKNSPIKLLFKLKQVLRATDQEVLEFIRINKLHGIGIGYLDAHLLASARTTQLFGPKISDSQPQQHLFLLTTTRPASTNGLVLPAPTLNPPPASWPHPPPSRSPSPAWPSTSALAAPASRQTAAVPAYPPRPSRPPRHTASHPAPSPA